MRNLIIVISLVFIAIIAVSYFYFSNLAEKDTTRLPEIASEEAVGTPEEPPASDKGILWTFELNGGAINRPSIHRYDDSMRFILIQDAYHILHAISPRGQKLWNAQLPGPIVDSISQLTDGSLVFTTAERLYRIDTEGDPLPGFSLTLPQRATQGAIATGEGPVRIEVETSRQVLSYDGRGRLLRRQARNLSDHTDETDEPAPTAATLPHGCGPFAYIGTLDGSSQRYLLCGKDDRKLYCFLY
ncbi:hypothetical protein [Parapedobacter sp.]